MKKIIISIFLALFSVICSGKDNGALKFLGIPVDGTESQFAAKLKGKGFTYNPIYKSYEGQFNGSYVNVYIHTNHDMVDRVYVMFPSTSKEDIIVEYNRLLGQFRDNAKYVDFNINKEIPEGEDISYEISAKNKQYQASFSYFDPQRDQVAFMDALLNKLEEFFTDEQMAKLREYCLKSIDAPDSEQERLQAEMMAEMQTLGLSQSGDGSADEGKSVRFLLTFIDSIISLEDGSVWFMIHQNNGKYYIGLYYDNVHNQAHGEDL